AALVATREPEAERCRAPQTPPEPQRERERPRRERKRAGEGERPRELLGLFVYHRDAPLVARALGVSLSDLVAELESLKIRRKAFALTRGTDHDLPKASPLERARSGPPVRRRPSKAAVAPPARPV